MTEKRWIARANVSPIFEIGVALVAGVTAIGVAAEVSMVVAATALGFVGAFLAESFVLERVWRARKPRSVRVEVRGPPERGVSARTK